jgi:CRISPR type IV-associated protein Csf3
VQFCAKPSVPTTRGSFKEYRTPIRVVTTDSLSGLCVGNKDEVQRLLNKVEFLGKKGSQGRGYVVAWEVSEIDLDNEKVISKIMRNRPVPVEFIKFMGANTSELRTRNIGWTPPYWHHTRFADCVVC